MSVIQLHQKIAGGCTSKVNKLSTFVTTYPGARIMATPNPPARVPEWLRRSGFGNSLLSPGDSWDEPVCFPPELPRCDVQCTDAKRLYLVMGAWCLSWKEVPIQTFLPLWRALSSRQRRRLVRRYSYYAEELDESRWQTRMFERDDEGMFAAYLQMQSDPTQTLRNLYRFIIAKGAVRCFEFVAQNEHVYWFKSVYNKLGTVSCGRLTMLKALITHGCTPNCITVMTTVAEGYTECLAYLLGPPWNLGNAMVCLVAADRGYLDCLKCAHEMGCLWDSGTCAGAASGGHLECLRYAHENGCPWRESTLYYAIRRNRVDCLRYALEHDCPSPMDDAYCETAVKYGFVEILHVLREYGCPWNEAVYEMAKIKGRVECIEYLREHRCPGTYA